MTKRRILLGCATIAGCVAFSAAAKGEYEPGSFLLYAFEDEDL